MLAAFVDNRILKSKSSGCSEVSLYFTNDLFFQSLFQRMQATNKPPGDEGAATEDDSGTSRDDRSNILRKLAVQTVHSAAKLVGYVVAQPLSWYQSHRRSREAQQRLIEKQRLKQLRKIDAKDLLYHSLSDAQKSQIKRTPKAESLVSRCLSASRSLALSVIHPIMVLGFWVGYLDMPDIEPQQMFPSFSETVVSLVAPIFEVGKILGLASIQILNGLVVDAASDGFLQIDIVNLIICISLAVFLGPIYRKTKSLSVLAVYLFTVMPGPISYAGWYFPFAAIFIIGLVPVGCVGIFAFHLMKAARRL